MSAAHDFDVFILSLLTFPNEEIFFQIVVALEHHHVLTDSTPSLTATSTAEMALMIIPLMTRSPPGRCTIVSVLW